MTIDATFTAVLKRSPSKGGWTYVVWPRSELPVEAQVRD